MIVAVAAGGGAFCAPAWAGIAPREPVLLALDARTVHVHGGPRGRAAAGTVTDVEIVPGGSRVTVELTTPIGGVTRVTDEVPSADYGPTTKWTDTFDAVHVGDVVTATLSRAADRPTLTSLRAPAGDKTRTRAGRQARWSPFGQPFLPFSLPHSWELQADLAKFAFDGVTTGVRWWQADALSFWQLEDAGRLFSSPQLGSCARGVPPGSWMRFGEVREAYNGAIGVATYCTDESGRSAFEVVLDYRVDYDLDLVAAHELGHGIGFGHSDDLASAMYPIAYPKDALGADDLNGLRSMYPGRIAAYAELPEGLHKPPGGDPRARAALVSVVAVGEPGVACDPGSARLRVDPPAARASFHGTSYEPRTGIAVPEATQLGDSVCRFRIEARPSDDDDDGPGRVTLTPIHPGIAVAQAAEANVRLPRPPKIASVVPSPQGAYPGAVVSLDAAVSDPDADLATVAWDTDADGAFDDAFGVHASTSFSTPGAKLVSVQAVDREGLRTKKSATVSVDAPPITPQPAPAPSAGDAAGGQAPGSSRAGEPTPSSGSGTASGSTSAGSSPRSARLRVLSAEITRGSRLRLHVAFSARADAHKIRVKVHARGRTRTYWPKVRGGRIKFDQKLARSQRGGRRITVWLRFRGNANIAPASATIDLG